MVRDRLMSPEGIHGRWIEPAIQEGDFLDRSSHSVRVGQFSNQQQSPAQLAT
jgi:hypothetical protein